MMHRNGLLGFGAFLVLGGCMALGCVSGYAESPKAILHDTGETLKEATRKVETVVRHGSHAVKHDVKTGTVTKTAKHWGRTSKRNLKKAVGK